MKKTLLVFVAGLLLGQLDPLGFVAWQLIEARLPDLKTDSLSASSPFEEMPRSRWIAESQRAFVIEDPYAPTAPVHLLVIPKERVISLLEAPSSLLAEMLELARAAARDRGIAESGFRVVINTNPQGGQTVYHLHMHVKGGRQLREPLLPLIWSRLIHWRAASATIGGPCHAAERPIRWEACSAHGQVFALASKSPRIRGTTQKVCPPGARMTT